MMQTFPVFEFTSIRQTLSQLARNRMDSCGYRTSLLSILLFLSLSSLSLGQSLSVSMSYPAFRSSFITGSQVNIQTNTTTPASTTVTKVEFFLATFTGPGNSKVTVKLGEDLTAPFSYTWTIPDGQVSYNELSAVVTNTTGATAVQGGTGYIRVDVYPPNTNSNKKYYVQAGANPGTAGTLVAPFNTIQRGIDAAAPGDSIFVMAGTYTNAAGSDVVVIRRTGTPTNWIVFTNYQNDKPKLSFNGYQGFNLVAGAAYIKIQGFEIVGNNANVTLPQATTQPGSCDNPTGTVNPAFNGNGISANGRTGGNARPHHIVLANNSIHDCGGAGISAIESDYVTVENNTVYNNSWYTIFGASGISFLNSWNYDNNTDTPKMIIRNNICYGNRLFVKWIAAGVCRGITDGNGIILDNNNNQFGTTNPNGAYNGKFLIENNSCYQNGGRGVNINYSDNATIRNNTFYQNAASPEITSEFAMRYSTSVSIYNNIFYSRSDKATGVPVNSPNLIQSNNLTFGGTDTPFFTGSQSLTGVNPQFVDAAGGNFQLASTSPALNAGSSISGQYALKDILGVSRPQGASVDMGAYELQGTPMSITQQPASNSVVCAGTSVSVSVGVDGPVQAYQWYKDGNALTGVTSATTATLSFSAVTVADQGSYSVVISGFNSLTSSTFSLTVNAPPTVSITANPSLTATTGSSVTLTASGADTYRWNTGATTAVLSASTAATYSVTGITANGCSATATATVILLAPPTVSIPFPQFNSSYISGTDINIQATATTPTGTTITKVEFFYDAAFSGTYTKIGEDLTAPYSIIWTAPAVPANGRSYQIRAIVTNSASATAVSNAPTNYVGIAVYPANYVSTRNWYVNASASATNTAGTEVSPVNTIQKAADRVAPGDIVYVMAGTYTATSSDIVSIRRVGTPNQPIVFIPYNSDKPVLQMGNNNWQAFNVLPAAAYIKIQGFDIIGNNANITLAQAQAQPGACEGPSPAATPIARFNGNGISISGRTGGNLRPHHVVLANNYIHDCAGGGISAIEADYITIEDNIITNTSWYTVYGTSGISVFNSWNYDNTTTTPRMIVRRNRSFGTILKIAWNIGGTGTNCKFYDGNGIILDNNRGADPNNANAIKNALGDYTGKFLLENNICYKNGGRGININYSDNATIINNTTYQNGQSDGSFGIGIDNEFIMQGSIGARIFNNIFYGKPGENPSSVSGSSDILQNNNLTFSNAGNGYFTNNQNIVGRDPQFVDAATGDFRLASTSPAINAGSSTAGQYAAKDILGIDRPQGSGVDIGAYELQGTPVSFSQQPASNSVVCAGTSVSVSVGVDGPVQAYQWYKDGSALTGVTSATTATLSLSAVTSADQGSYYVVVTGFNSLTSSAFDLAVNAVPVAGLMVTGVLTCDNPDSVTLTASPNLEVSYVFSLGAIQVGNTNQATVTQAGTYSVTVTNGSGCSATAQVAVSSCVAPAPDLTLLLYAQPSTLYNGDPFTVVVDVIELNLVPTSGPITVKLTKDASMALTFGSSLTTLAGRSIENESWIFSDSDATYYVLTTTQVISKGGKLSFGLSGVLNARGTVGVATSSAVLLGGSGGEVKATNNTDSDKMDFFQQ